MRHMLRLHPPATVTPSPETARLSRAYLKIFLSFWLMTIVMVTGSILVVHWYELSPGKHITELHSSLYESQSGRLLRDFISEAVNYPLEDVITGVADMPDWAAANIYVVDPAGADLLQRPLPPAIAEVARQISAGAPTYPATGASGKDYLGRYLQLQDGTELRVITVPEAEGLDLRWRLFIFKLWPVLLICMLISAATTYFLTRHFTRDVHLIQNAARRIAKGDMQVGLSAEFGGRRDEMAVLAGDIDQMAQSLRKAMFEQKRLIKDVSHELRSPLARLQIALAIAQQRSDGNINSELERIREAADYLNDVISDILSLPVNEMGEWELNDAVELNSLLWTLISHCRCEAKQKEVKLNLRSDVEDGLVMTHGNTLIGAIENIVRNAIHYTTSGSCVDITLQECADKHFVVRVRDHGPGVDAANLQDIFEPFFRTDEARARSSGGYGLGLSIAQRTILLHGGTVEARNHKSGGLELTVLLPAAV
jgi:two-component system sensor histidine kinase CpxA